MSTNYKKDQVDIITLNYNGEKILPLLFDSLENITYKNNKVYMVDNGSKDQSIELTEKMYPWVNIFKSPKNLFFSRGNNLAINQTDGEFILLINNDIVVKPDFLDHMVKAIKKDDNIAAVASKMMLNDNPTILDSVGTAILDNGAAFNRGIGQVDIGQYDDDYQVFGACFGCVLIRRSYYENEIGSLDNDYFGYFEDTDWSYRANILGYKIILEPKAVVFHAHSVTSRQNVPDWKQYLIQRNYIWTAQKNFRASQAFKITLVRYRELLRNAWHYKTLGKAWLNFKIISITLITLPRTLLKRVKIQKKRKVSDSEITKYSDGETTFFEDVNYRVLYTLDNLEYTLKRKAISSEEHKELFDKVKSLNESKKLNSKKWDNQATEFIKSLKFLDDNERDNFIGDIVVKKTWAY